MKLKRFPTPSGELYYGPLPMVADLKNIQRNNIDIIWNLAAELNVLVPYEKLYTKEVLFGNIPDFEAPSENSLFISQLEYVVNALKQGKKVFVHCHGGRGRTGTGLAAIDVAFGEDSDKALDKAMAYAGGPESVEQEEYIDKLDTLLNGRPEKPQRKRKSKWEESGYSKLWESLLGDRHEWNPKDEYGKEIDLSKWPEDEDYDAWQRETKSKALRGAGEILPGDRIDPNKGYMICPNCNRSYESNRLFCTYDGGKLFHYNPFTRVTTKSDKPPKKQSERPGQYSVVNTPTKKQCPTCHRFFRSNKDTCPHDGSKLEEKSKSKK